MTTKRKKYFIKYKAYSRLFNEHYIARTTTFNPENYNNIVEMWEVEGGYKNMKLIRRIK